MVEPDKVLSLENKKILITGGAGLVGSHITDKLLQLNAGQIVIVDNLIRGNKDNLKDAFLSNKVRFVNGDISDRKSLDEYFQGVDYCFHLAALRITYCVNEPRLALEVMYDGMFNVLESCVRHKVKKVVYSSTVSVYGQADIFPTPETHHPYNNVTLYGAAKFAGELMLRSFNHMYDLPYNILRYFNVYGPRMDAYGKYTEVFIKWYDAIRAGKPPMIYGDGRQSMDYVFVDDVARATVMALTTPVEQEVFNVGTGKEYSITELCHLLLEVMQSDLKPVYVPVPEDRKKVEVKQRRADVSKAYQVMGFEAKFPLKEGLKLLVGWLDDIRKNPPLK